MVIIGGVALPAGEGDEGLQGKGLCVDFVNTVDWRERPEPDDSLSSYRDLVTWGRDAGATTRDEAERLLAAAEARPAQAEKAFDDAIETREAIYRILAAAGEGRPARTVDLDTLNRALAAAMARLRVAPRDGTFAWVWLGTGEELDRMMWPVAKSAADLLASPDLDRVRKCGGEGCGWLFLDTTKNRSRRWCDMKSCGNRAKARRHYGRTRTAAGDRGKD